MSAPAGGQVPWYGTTSDWAEILKGGAQGASSALQGAAQYANTKEEAREAKRRTLANQDYQDEMNDFQSQALQQVARGFVDALQGSTGRG
jgi:hypothetical protein